MSDGKNPKKTSAQKNRSDKKSVEPQEKNQNPEDKPMEYLPKKKSDYTEHSSKKERKEEKEFKERKKRVKHQSNEIPPLSQSECEHLTYLRVLGMFNEMKAKRRDTRKYGTLFIIFSGIVFLLLMFSLDAKIEFLMLWILTTIYCIFLMVRADYQYHTFKELLGIADEFDYYDYDESEEKEEPPKQPEMSAVILDKHI